jgi:hypothetical protein
VLTLAFRRRAGQAFGPAPALRANKLREPLAGLIGLANRGASRFIIAESAPRFSAQGEKSHAN